jgi:hypothetical protein
MMARGIPRLIHRVEAAIAAARPTDDPGLTRAERRHLQQLLLANGYNIGEADGKIGPVPHGHRRCRDTLRHAADRPRRPEDLPRARRQVRVREGSRAPSYGSSVKSSRSPAVAILRATCDRERSSFVRWDVSTPAAASGEHLETEWGERLPGIPTGTG